MRFRDVTSLALRGLPPKSVDRAPPQAVTHRPDRSTPLRSAHSPRSARVRNGKALDRPGRLTPASSHRTNHTVQAPVNPLREPLMVFSDPLSDIKVGVRHATLFPGLRTPGLASPGTFPSRCFPHPQGFAPPSLFAVLFHTAATFRISSTDLQGLQDKSGASQSEEIAPPPSPPRRFRKPILRRGASSL